MVALEREDLNIRRQIARANRTNPPAIVRLYERDNKESTTGSLHAALALQGLTWPLSTAGTAAPAYDKTPFRKWFDKLEQLGKLPNNWNSYGAEAPNVTAQYWAEQILTALLKANLPPLRLKPSAENGVAIIFRSGDKYADIECFNNGSIMAVMSNGAGHPEVWEIFPHDDGEIEHAIRKINGFIR
jgi:hypothetical protein